MISHEPLEHGVGARVELDLSAPMDAETEQELRDLLARHDLLLFRGNALGREDHDRVMTSLGRGHVLANDYQRVSNIDPEDATGTIALPFHSDYAFLPEPIAALSLHAVEVVDGASATIYCSGRRAFHTLPSNLRQRIQDLDILNVLPLKTYERNRAADLPPDSPSFTRPAVIPHPADDDRVVYLSWLNADSFVGLAADESETLLQELATHVFDPANLYEHRWSNGDVVIWDNVAVTHSRGDVADVGPRVLQRASVGKYHFRDLYPDWRRPDH